MRKGGNFITHIELMGARKESTVETEESSTYIIQEEEEEDRVRDKGEDRRLVVVVGTRR